MRLSSICKPEVLPVVTKPTAYDTYILKLSVAHSSTTADLLSMKPALFPNCVIASHMLAGWRTCSPLQITTQQS